MTGRGCCSAWRNCGGRPARDAFDAANKTWVSAAVAGFAEVLGLRLAYGPVGSTAPSLPIFLALDEVTESALVVRPLRDAGGAVADFVVVHMSPGYAGPGRPPGRRAGRADARLRRTRRRILVTACSPWPSGSWPAARPSACPGPPPWPAREPARVDRRGGRGPGHRGARGPVLRGSGLHLAGGGGGGGAGRPARPRPAPGPHRRLGGEPGHRGGPVDRLRVRGLRPRPPARGTDPHHQPAQLRDRRRPRAGAAVPPVAAAPARARRRGIPHRPPGGHRHPADPRLRRAGAGRRRGGGAAGRVPGRLRALPHPGRAGRDPGPAGRQRAAGGGGAAARAAPAARDHAGGRFAGGGRGGRGGGPLPAGRAGPPGGR